MKILLIAGRIRAHIARPFIAAIALFTVVIALSMPSVAVAQLVISDLTATSVGKDFTLRWEANDKSLVKRYTSASLQRLSTSPDVYETSGRTHLTNLEEGSSTGFTPDFGTYRFRIGAVLNGDTVHPDTLEIFHTLTAAPPKLTGLASTVNGNRVTMTWTAPSGDAVASITNYRIQRTSPGTPTVSFNTNVNRYLDVVPVVGIFTYTIRATSKDGDGAFSDGLVVTVMGPIARAGGDASRDEGVVVSLSGAQSIDNRGGALTYNWIFYDSKYAAGTNSLAAGLDPGLTVAFDQATSARPAFTTPSNLADTVLLTFRLTVTDSSTPPLESVIQDADLDMIADVSNTPVVVSSTDTMDEYIIITVTAATPTPTAAAGNDASSNEGVIVTLSGQASQANGGTALTYRWEYAGSTFVDGGADAGIMQDFDAAITLSNPSLTTPTNLSGDVNLSFTLTVSNTAATRSDSDSIVLMVNATPIAVAGVAQNVELGTTVTLNGGGSSDPAVSAALTYTWTQIGSPPASLMVVLSGAADAAIRTFTAPTVTADTTLTFNLAVADASAATSSATVEILIVSTISSLALPDPDNRTLTQRNNAENRPTSTPEAYTFTLPVATGGTAPYRYTITPNGVADASVINSNIFTWTVPLDSHNRVDNWIYSVTDSAPAPITRTQTFSVTNVSTPTFAEISSITVGEDAQVSMTLSAAMNGASPYTYSLIGVTQVGLAFDSDSAARVLSGIATPAGTYSLEYTATDSNQVSTTTLISLIIVAAPGKVVVFTVNDLGTINLLTWAKPSGTVTDYQIQRRLDSDAAFTDSPIDITVDGTLIIASETIGDGRIYRIRAINGLVAPGPWSEEVLATDDGDTAMLSKPRDLAAARNNDNGDVTLTWRAPASSGPQLFTFQIQRNGVALSGAQNIAADIYTYTDLSAPVPALTYIVTAIAPMVDISGTIVQAASVASDPATAAARDFLPMVNAGINQAVLEGVTVTLSGSASDVDDVGVALTYAWMVEGVPAPVMVDGAAFTFPANVSTPTMLTATYDTTNLPSNTKLILTLTASHTADSAISGTDQVEITITPPSDPPTGVTITNSETTPVDSTITLAATIADADGAIAALTFAWTFSSTLPEGATVTGTAATGVSDPEIANPTYDTTGLPSGTMLTFGLTVTSDDVDVNADPKVITIQSGNLEQVAAIVSEVARAIVSSTVSAVTSRISSAARGGVNIGGLSLNENGAINNMASVVQNNAQALSTNSDAMKALLGNSDVSFPLNAKGGSDGGINSLAVWASGEYSDLSGKSAVVDWEGELSGFHLGVDGKIQTGNGNNILVGVALSSLNSDLDYKENDDSANEGNYEIGMTTISPYIGWRAGVVDLWASVGVGDGEIERNPDGDEKTSNDATQISYAIGGGADLVSAGDASLRINGEVMQSTMDLDGDRDDADDDGQTLNSNRVRISMEMSLLHNLLRGGVFKPSVEVGLRYDGGDGETGTGMELGGKLQYYSANGFTAEGSARVLLAHSGEYDEWGIQGTVRKQVGRDGQGLSFHLTPAYGDVNSGVQQLLAQGLRGSDNAADDATDSDYQIHLTTRLGYGIAMRNAHGMLTPYTEMVLGTTDQYRMGINWKPNQAFNLTLLGEQATQSGKTADTENSLRLQGAINF